ncbi:DEAD-domain-containing protein [Neoconidiobolus thromboides FSU 785]|nr:DEAD-domain-containing protein [Neoconidiobolus thromboides FSU 785]
MSSDSEIDIADALIPKYEESTTKSSKGNKKSDNLDMADLGDEDEDNNLRSIITKKKKLTGGGFQSMGLSSFLLKSIQKKGYKQPTPIQRKCIPLIMENLDLVGMARTGSGKTAAFVIPLIEKLKTHSSIVGARGLIFSTNRELAFQTAKVVSELSKGTDIRNCAIVGGESMEEQYNLLAGNPDIIIATPGRLLHLVVEMEIDLRTIEYVVFDEADRLFEMGFDVQLRELLSRLPASRQTLLFSATLPKNLVEFAKAGLQDPTLVRLDADTKISQDLEMAFFSVKQDVKEAALLFLLREVIKCPKSNEVDKTIEKKDKKKKEYFKPIYPNQSIIFVSTKHHVDYIATLLEEAGYDCGKLYGSMDQTARQIQIQDFRNQQVPLFVVTDVAARGIDIPILENVINYDFVDQAKVFVHRVGRVARAGKRGWAYSFVTMDELAYFYDLQLFLGRPLITAAQISEDMIDDIDYTTDVVIGTLANEISLVDDIEWLHNKFNNIEIEGLRKVAINGSKMFRKSRKSVVAARESHQKAKELLRSGQLEEIHPLLIRNIKEEEKDASEFLKGISGFKPRETIFEVKARGTKKATPASEAMKKRRSYLDDKIVDYRHQQKELSHIKPVTLSQKSKSNLETVETSELEKVFKVVTNNKSSRNTKKDEENYISYYQKDAYTEKGYSLQSGSFEKQTMHATLDLTGDDRATEQFKQNQLRWDKKKKKFVRGDGTGADNKKLLKTESGNKIQASFKKGNFAEWQRKQGVNMPKVGDIEMSGSNKKLQDAKLKRRFKHHTKEVSNDNKKIKSELKSSTEIRKEREKKEQRRLKTGRHKPKGGNKNNKRH